jgi:hypothetical protein
MSTVAPIRADVVISEGKQTFLDTVADAFDEMTAREGVEPLAIIYSLVCQNGSIRNGYHTLGECADVSSLYVSRGVMSLNADAMQWDYTK